ncbi:helix-turn-helix transcriptional regulator [Gluconacetobacter azotocaptans]|uniref:Helix-turn-helix transcriptional regulator n=1 Tax=Gluconacetobacter azotocaptans TaxID=142834 RepID=A0A7W4JQ17_9PROT|nr:helix-turn-helix transcriptional regulator [Gluconacetobacter azotocaptans]MBB2188824.1 helix-turn-helix transcriptional regulator [Gluconacetobacter azotocaptans]MBM9402550.1 helix-turn-helix transcriptional regulator [Gluconacetobacter azotocaptans]GBQ31151.1 transcriptional regulator [Gluconacetobacter azotocaptans DSM 13594]
MIRHHDLWQALDTLAAERGLTPSGLARAAGLDVTAFNPSKRMTPSGRPRWPGTESLARALDATGTTLEAFSRLLEEGHAPHRAGRPVARMRLRMSPLSHLEQDGMFDAAGLPAGRHWDAWDSPGPADSDCYAVMVDTDAFDPVFRAGAVLVVSPGAAVRHHDRVILRRPDAILCAIVGDGGDDGPTLRGIGAQDGMDIPARWTDHLHRITMAVL